MRNWLRLSRARLADDRGNIGVLMAFVIFIVIGSMMMTWNSAQLSKEKMRLQNAADSAALGFCVWQARGMNTLQNINDEMYVALSLAKKLVVVAAFFEGIAQGLDYSADLLSMFPITSNILRAAGLTSHTTGGMLLGGLSGWMANRVCKWLLVPIGYFYAYGSTPLGLWGAQQLAAKNRADPLGNASLNTGTSVFGNLGLYALGFSIPLIDTVKLPVAQKDKPGAPWEVDPGTKALFQESCKYGFIKKFYKLCGTGEKWSIQPWVSKRDKKTGMDALPGPTIWVTHKYHDHIEALPLSVWAPKSTKDWKVMDKWPMMAISAAQCVTGDLVPHSVNPNKGNSQRPAGFGTGATAKLIPVATAFNAITKNGVANGIFKRIIYH